MKFSAPITGKRPFASIGHLINSKLGSGDRHISAQQSYLCIDKKRGKQDRVIVTEKMDGSNVCVVRQGTNLHTLTRSGILCSQSRFEQHRWFRDWVALDSGYLFRDMEQGMSIHGEWMAQSHGIRYHSLPSWFFVFDIKQDGISLPWDSVVEFCERSGLWYVPVLSDGPAISPNLLIHPVMRSSWLAEGEKGEGLVYRLETHGKVAFWAKLVFHWTQAGKYLPSVTGGEIEYNKKLIIGSAGVPDCRMSWRGHGFS